MNFNELAGPQKKRTTRRKGKRHAGQGTNPYDEVYNRLPDGYRPSVLFGIDPGMRALCTAAIAGSLPPRTRKRSATSKDLRRCNRNARKRRHLRGQRIMEISTREYRHMAMMNKTSDWHKNLQKREPWYAGICHAMPSFKMPNFELYIERLAFFWTHVGFLLTFTTEHAFLKYRFLQDRLKMKALDALTNRIVPVPSPQVCIAYGDWSKRDGPKGHASGYVKRFAEALKKRATVLPMDEYRTSKLCSQCHCCLKEARLCTKDKDGRLVLQENRNVLRCDNSSCRANFWN
jgi:hypothetical protein